MKRTGRWRLCLWSLGLLSMVGLAVAAVCSANAGPIVSGPAPGACGPEVVVVPEGPPCWDIGGQWYWLRSPEEEKRIVAALFNRYCIRCHGVDGRGVWDIPDVPNFTNAKWQAWHSDGQLARSILQGRGSIMPPFRGALTLEESWAMARYLRTFVPGTEASRPDDGEDKDSKKKKSPKKSAAPKK